MRTRINLLSLFSLAVLMPGTAGAADKSAKARFPAYWQVTGWPRLPASVKLGPVSAVATDSADRVYVLQRVEPPVLVLDRDGKLLRAWGQGLLKDPHGLRVDGNDHMWVTDTARHVVMKFDTSGKLLLSLGKKDRPGDGPDCFNKPTDVAVAPSGEIYVADGYGNSRVVKFSKQGKFLKQWGRKGTGEGQFRLPHAICLDSKGRVYVGDRQNRRVQVFDSDGKFIAAWKGTGAPYGLYIHGNHLFVADGLAGRILVLDLHGKVLGRLDTGTGEANAPHWVCVDGRGEVYVAYVDGRRVRKFTALGAGTSAQQKRSREEERARLARSPRQVAEQLASVYGKKLDQVAYISALPLIAKLRLSEATRDQKYAEEVYHIVAPFLRGEKSPIPRSGSEQAGHLIFAELALRSKGKDRERWTALCRSAADQIFGKDGKVLALMPYHNEMSDAVFMAGPILAATGKLTGERKYFDAAVTHFASMRKLCLRRDGLYRHSPLCEAAWGRCNGFPALGLALALSDWPDDHPGKNDLLAEFQKHMTALRPHQDAKTGCWHQVIDRPESYDEYSCTCMIGFAMQRGISRGWLKDDYHRCVARAWRAVKARTGADGKLVNVCTGTGKQKTLRDYLKRPAINGRDDRGGAMGLLFATELLASK